MRETIAKFETCANFLFLFKPEKLRNSAFDEKQNQSQDTVFTRKAIRKRKTCTNSSAHRLRQMTMHVSPPPLKVGLQMELNPPWQSTGTQFRPPSAAE